MTRLLAPVLFGLFLLVAADPLRAVEAKPVAAAPMESVLITRVEGSLVIDPEGKVESFEISTPLAAELRAGVDRAVTGWRFQPVRVDGQPVRARSAMIITLAGTRLGEGFRVKIDNVVFPVDNRGEMKAGYRIENPSASIVLKSMRPPGYPTDLMRAGISGTVLVAFRIGPDGRIAEASSVQSMLFDVRGRDRIMQKIVRQFEAVAVSAVKGWRFEVTQKAAIPSAREMTQYVSIVFLMQGVEGDPKPGLWRTVVRGASKAPAWLPPTARTMVGVADLAGGRMLTPDARVVLTTEVAGTDLM